MRMICISRMKPVIVIISIFLSACATVDVQRAAPIEVALPEAEEPLINPTEQMAIDFESLLASLPDLELSERIGALEEFNALWPDAAGGYINLAIIYFNQQNWTLAKSSVSAALTRSPRNALAYNIQGAILRQENDFRGARIAYEKAILADPAYPPAYLNLAILYDIYLQYWQDAKEYYQKYLELDPAQEAQVTLWIADLDYRIRNYGGDI